MQTIQRSERYTDKGHHAVMTRTTGLKEAHLARIADHLHRNAEDLVASTEIPTLENCRIAGAIVGWAFNLVPLRIQMRFDY